MTIVRLVGWRAWFGKTKTGPPALRMAWSASSVLARRGMVWEQAILLDEPETWIGGEHGHDSLDSVTRRGASIVRLTTLHHPDGQAIATTETGYSVDGPTLMMRSMTTWSADVTWKQRYVGMLPCAPWMATVLVGGDGPKTLGLGDIVWSRSRATSATACGRRWTGRLEVNEPCVMSAHCRKDGRTVKLYADSGPGQARAGDRDERTALFTFTKE